MMRRTVAAVIIGLIAVHDSAAEQDEAAQVKALQKERVDTLSKLVELCHADYGLGMIRCEDVINAETELVDAQMEATENPGERIARLTEGVKRETELLKIIQSRREAERVSLANVYRAKSLLLNTKIRLLRERSKQRTPTR